MLVYTSKLRPKEKTANITDHKSKILILPDVFRLPAVLITLRLINITLSLIFTQTSVVKTSIITKSPVALIVALQSK